MTAAKRHATQPLRDLLATAQIAVETVLGQMHVAIGRCLTWTPEAELTPAYTLPDEVDATEQPAASDRGIASKRYAAAPKAKRSKKHGRGDRV